MIRFLNLFSKMPDTSENSPPKLAERFLRWYCDPDLLEEIQGDMLESYKKRMLSRGEKVASRHYLLDVIGFFRWSNIQKPSLFSNQHIMYTNYLKLSFRNLRSNRGYSLINLLGLTIGIMSFFLIFLFVSQEMSYDTHHSRHKNIFRIVNLSDDFTGGGIAKIQGPAGPVLKESIEEVVETVRFSFVNNLLFAYEDKQFYESLGKYADPSVFDVFDYEFIYGNHTSLHDKNSIVLTERLSKKYFGNEDPINKLIEIDNDYSLIVTGVIKDLPATSHIQFSFLRPMEADERGWKEDWVMTNYYTYLLLDNTKDMPHLMEMINATYATHYPEESFEDISPHLQPLASIHMESHLHREMSASGNKVYLILFSLVGLFILLIASINFINIMTAKASERMKEVGVRKAVGASRGTLIFQFLFESFVSTAMSVSLALGGAYLLIPVVNGYFHTSLTMDVLSFDVLVIAGSLILFITVMAGGYPAFYLSSMKVSLLNGPGLSISKNRIRNVLTMTQFSISSFMVIAILIVTAQQKFIAGKNLGFQKSGLINISLNDREVIQNYESLKNRLLQNSNIESVSLSSNLLGGGDYGIPIRAEGISEQENPDMRMLVVDHSFIQTYKMHIAQGREFTSDAGLDQGAYILNETAAKMLGWKNPIGKTIAMPAIEREAGPVIGVLEDFHFRSLHNQIQPIMLFIQPAWFNVVSIRVNAARIPETLSFLEKEWKDIEPAFPFSYSFFDQRMERLYASEVQTAKILKWTAFLAMFLSCMGLFSLSSFDADRKKKEFGVRKVLGASVFQIVKIQFVRFTLLIAVGAILAIPLVIVAMNSWLNNFVYKVIIDPGMITSGVFITLVIAWITIAHQTIRSALSNPIKSLKEE